MTTPHGLFTESQRAMLASEDGRSWLESGRYSGLPVRGYRRCVCGEWDVDHSLLACDRPGCACQRWEPAT